MKKNDRYEINPYKYTRKQTYMVCLTGKMLENKFHLSFLYSHLYRLAVLLQEIVCHSFDEHDSTLMDEIAIGNACNRFCK